MKYDLSIPYDKNKAAVRLAELSQKSAKIEIKKIIKKRTISQNAYLHVIITLYAIHFGLTINEAKTDLKRACHFMVYQKEGKQYLKETRHFDTRELTEFIDWIRNYSAQHNCYLPTSEEYLTQKFSIDRDIDRNKEYL